MKLRAVFSTAVVLALSSSVLYAQRASSTLTLTEKTEAPGISLSPGTYNVAIENRLQDRMIVEFQKEGSGKTDSLLAFPSPSLADSGTPGAITYSHGLKNKPTLRGYAFPGGMVAEFIYPKKDAVALATANDVQVLAVDPASQGMEALPHLTPGEMTEVTLWMLTPSLVQPGAKPAVQAARYQVPSPAPSTTMAQSTPPPPSVAPTPAETASSVDAQTSAPTPAVQQPRPTSDTEQVARTEAPSRPYARRVLPTTASDLPAVALAMLSFLLLALILRLYRFRTEDQI